VSADTKSVPRLLGLENLDRCCDCGRFNFKTTAELEEISESVGQDRTLEAVRFGIGVRRLRGPLARGRVLAPHTD